MPSFPAKDDWIGWKPVICDHILSVVVMVEPFKEQTGRMQLLIGMLDWMSFSLPIETVSTMVHAS